MLTVQQAIDLAIQRCRSGQFAEAEALCRQILSRDPNEPGALHLLGMIAHRAGNSAAAIDLIRRAIAINPSTPIYYQDLGIVLADSGQLDQAIQSLTRAVELQPQLPQAHYNRAYALEKVNRWDEALTSYQRAASLDPNQPMFLHNLAIALRVSGRMDEAIQTLQKALALRPDYVDAYLSLGNALRQRGDFEGAIAAYLRAAGIAPNSADAYNNLGNVLQESGRKEQAIEAYRKALELQPNNPGAIANLGNALQLNAQFDEAIVRLRRAVQLQPDYVPGYNNLGAALWNKGLREEAIAQFRHALSLQPDDSDARLNLAHADADTRLNLAHALLAKGEYAEGWKHYEARLSLRTFQEGPSDKPRWDGSDLGGRSILLRTEQGLGDIIQFARFAPLVAARGGRVILQVPPPLVRLLENQCKIDRVISNEELPPEFDVHFPLLSLPGLLGTTLQTLPAKPYLSSDASEVERWSSRVVDNGGNLKTGLVWAGSPTNTGDKARSFPLAAMAPLAQAPGIRFFTLQKGEAAKQAMNPPAGMALTHFTEELRDFADTAAFIANLDLVICCDTSVAHLAGAMGKPTWVVLSFVPDWRWLLDRSDSPWYPTIKLFRQPRAGDWQTPMEQVAEQLKSYDRGR